MNNQKKIYKQEKMLKMKGEKWGRGKREKFGRRRQTRSIIYKQYGRSAAFHKEFATREYADMGSPREMKR